MRRVPAARPSPLWSTRSGRTVPVVVILAGLALGISACGGGSPQASSSTPTTSEATSSGSSSSSASSAMATALEVRRVHALSWSHGVPRPDRRCQRWCGTCQVWSRHRHQSELPDAPGCVPCLPEIRARRQPRIGPGSSGRQPSQVRRVHACARGDQLSRPEREREPVDPAEHRYANSDLPSRLAGLPAVYARRSLRVGNLP